MEPTSDAKRYRITGFVLISAGLLSNPWLLNLMTGGAFSATLFNVVLAVSVLLIFAGISVVFKGKLFFLWIVEKYRDFAVIVLNFLILFGLLNVVAALLIKKPVDTKPDISYFFSPRDLLVDSIELMRKVYPGKSDDDIRDLLMLTSPYANHPVLEFQERVQASRFYNTGFEGIRFDQTVTRLNAPQKINGAVWVFGGSTTFGHGVGDNETIPAFLNQLDTVHTYINFGVHAYHQSNEIDKLLLLLRKGYQPEKVIFIDGLNDLIRMIETNFHPLETPALAKSAYGSDYTIETRRPGPSFLGNLPVTRWLRMLVDEDEGTADNAQLPWNQYDNVYDAENLYNTDPMLHFRSTLRRSPFGPIDSAGLEYIVWKMTELYSANYRFMEKLAVSCNFDFQVFFQPQGILSAGNPFWRDQRTFQQTPLYRNFDYVIPRISAQIAAWKYPEFHDISTVHDSCPACYLDLTHYNPELNRAIARSILKTPD